MLQKDQRFTYICIYYIKLTKEGQGKMASVLFDWLLISLLANGVEQEKENVPSSLVLWRFWRFKQHVTGKTPRRLWALVSITVKELRGILPGTERGKAGGFLKRKVVVEDVT